MDSLAYCYREGPCAWHGPEGLILLLVFFQRDYRDLVLNLEAFHKEVDNRPVQVLLKCRTHKIMAFIGVYLQWNQRDAEQVYNTMGLSQSHSFGHASSRADLCGLSPTFSCEHQCRCSRMAFKAASLDYLNWDYPRHLEVAARSQRQRRKGDPRDSSSSNHGISGNGAGNGSPRAAG